jgi:iron(III) transport system ATP-binding protein
MVFQPYPLWPHMTVRKNIGYPRRARRIRTEESKNWITETATLVDCQNLLDRYPAQLSGGQQQRVALARGLVARPEVVLFDEPLSNLDARLRDLVRAQLHELHARLGFTAIFVTHDQTEALALADRMAIMRAGKFEQIGTPVEVFERPATEYVAGFIGMSNRIELTRAAEGWTVNGQPARGDLPIDPSHGVVIARLRPDDVTIGPSAESLPESGVTFGATFVDAQFGGRHYDVTVELEAGHRVGAKVSVDILGGWVNGLEHGAPVTVGLARAGVVYFSPDDTRIDVGGAAPAVLASAGA